MAAPAAEMLDFEMLEFEGMNDAELGQWVEANPGRVNDKDSEGDTPLCAAARHTESLPLVVWLLDEKGADVNGTTADGRTAIYWAASLDILIVLLDRGGDSAS